jgi:hypothetical protein
MKIYSNTAVENPSRIVLPVLEEFPNEPLLGEVIFFNLSPQEGLYIFTGNGWKPLHSTQNNIWESHTAEPEQVIFELKNHYPTNGKSLVVYKDGVRLKQDECAEVGTNLVAWKGEELLGGELFEFQMFNIKIHSIFDIKAFNRRNG